MTSAQLWIEAFALFIVFFGLFQNVVYALQLPAAWLELRRHSRAEDTESDWQLLVSEAAMPISLIIPAYNEGVTIVENVRTMLSLKYPEIEIIVVNDGSTDDTLERLIDAFSLTPTDRAYDLPIQHKPIRALYASSLYPNLLVVDKENGHGKADSTNAGVNLARTPLFCVIDADSVLEPEALLRSVRPFMENPKEMVAVGGTIRILNGCTLVGGQIKEVGLAKNPLALIQTLEYLRAFLMARLAWSRWKMLTIISGAFGIFRRDITVAVGGFEHNTVGEDYELVVKMHRYLREQGKPYKMRYVPEPVCWTEAPETLEMLGNQRKRWQRGALEVFWKHRDLFLNGKYGRVGYFAFFNNFVTDVAGPIAELIGYFFIPIFWALGILDTSFMLAYVAMFFMFGVFISICSLVLEEMELRRHPRAMDLVILAFAAFVENFGYRQLNNYWRMVGWWEFVRGKKSWGVMTRKGAGAVAPSAS